jgi:hypothetical protein
MEDATMMSLSNGIDLSNVISGKSSAPVGEGETAASVALLFCEDDLLLLGGLDDGGGCTTVYASTNQRANSFIPPMARKVFITV